MLETFTKAYGDRRYQHTAMVRHKGRLIAFAQDTDRRIHYAVLDLDDPSNASPLDHDHWPDNPLELQFPDEIAEVGAGVADQTTMPVVKKGSRVPATPEVHVDEDERDAFLSSTARLSELAPFQVLSDGRFVYLFRQAIASGHPDVLTVTPDGTVNADGQGAPLVDSTLLLDRFVLSGGRLETKMEVRYQRSRSRSRPQNNKDSLGARDMEERPFREPTQEVRFVGTVSGGRFHVLLLPTQMPGVQRWQIFTHNPNTGALDSYNVEREEDGLFNTRGSDPTARMGQAESALSFEGDDARLELEAPVSLGDEFTQELWIRSDAAGAATSPAADGLGRALTGGGTPRTGSGAPSMWLVGRGAIRFGFGDGNRWYEALSRNVLRSGWNHVALTYNGRFCSLVVNGEERVRPDQLTVFADGVEEDDPTATAGLDAGTNPVGRVGASTDSFRGLVDEVRLWSRARSADELRGDMSRRLNGREPGLVGYWRLDEAHGDSAHDQTDRATPAARLGATAWVTSDAPIGIGSGLHRSSIRVAGRRFTSAPSALLYFHQEQRVGGYAREAKPMKHRARVMLAVATEADDVPNQEIAALDIGVSAEGLLAQLPDSLPLATVRRPTIGGTTIEERLALVTRLGQQLVGAEAEVVNLTEEIADLNRAHDNIEAAITRSTYRVDLAPGDLSRINGEIEGLRGARADAVAAARTAHWLRRYLSSARVVLYEHVNFAGRQLRFGPGWHGYTYLNRFGFNDLVSSISVPEPLQVAVYEHARFRGRSHLHRQTTRWVGRSWNDIISSLRVEEDPDFSKRRRTADEERAAADRRAAQRVAALRAQQRRLSGLISTKEAERQRAGSTAARLRADLETERSFLAEGVSVSMSLVHTDPNGISVTGGLLGFAWTNDAPELFDSATGRLGLYFRGTDDQFFVAYFRTLTERARFRLADVRGETAVVCTARSSAPEMDAMTVAIRSETDPSLCTVEVVAGTRTETWRHVPSQPGRFAEVLNGEAGERAYVGTATAVATGGIVRLDFEDGLKRALAPGATLVVEGSRLIVEAPVSRDATQVPVSATSTLPADGPVAVFYIEYDYVRNAASDRVPTDLTNGSLLVEVTAVDARHELQVEQDPVGGATINSEWAAGAPGFTIAFDGAASYVDAPSTGDTFDAIGDVTIEAWIEPGEVTDDAGRAQIVQQSSPGSSYSLGLVREPLMSALALDGRDDRVLLPDDDVLDVVGAITIEAWVKPLSYDGLRNVVAHGYVASPQREVFLRINDGAYEVGSWDGSAHLVRVEMPRDDRSGLQWVHLAGVHDGSHWRLYRNGALAGSVADPVGSLPVNSSWAIGSRGFVARAERLFHGEIDEVRIWKRARTQAEIDADRFRRLSGKETDLVGHWHFEDQQARDASRFENHGRVLGSPSVAPSPLPGYSLHAAVRDRRLRTTTPFAGGSWTHVAAVHDQSYGVRLDGGRAWVECGTDRTLDIDRDLTAEVFVQIDSGAGPGGLLSKGRIDDGTDQDVPYCLYLDDRRHLVFAFEDSDHGNHRIVSPDPVATGRVVRLAVSRKHETKTTEVRDSEGQVIDAEVDQWDDICLYVDGQRVRHLAYTGTPAGNSDRALEVGRAQYDAVGPRHLAGIVTEVRIWNTAREPRSVAADIKGDEVGLVTWLRFEENEGNIAYDSKSTNHGRLRGGVRWVENPDPTASPMVIYRDGEPQHAVAASPGAGDTAHQFTLGCRRADRRAEFFQGEMEEVRIWRTARSQEQVHDSIFRRVVGEKQDLIAYYPFDADAPERLLDRSLRGNHLDVHGATLVLSTAPIGDDTPEVRSALAGIRTPFNGLLQSRPAIAEYGDMQNDSKGNLIGVLKRCYAFVRDDRWHLVTGFKVGNLVTEWLGQVQFDPQLIGYIEGAPPVPSENLTSTGTVLGEFADYNGASSIELTEAQSTTYTYAASRDTGFDMSVESKIGGVLGVEASAGFGLVVETVDVENVIGAHLLFEHSMGWLEDATTGSGVSTSKLSRMELRGAPENEDRVAHPRIGRRFVPENAGFALVQSDTADVFALRLEHNDALISFQMRPNPDIPKDWNIITFPVNPRYTKQGTLDGKVGFEPDPNYPNALTYSPDLSYFKPIEAYALKARLQREEERLRTLFDQYAAGAKGRRQADAHFSGGDLGSGRILQKLPSVEKRNLVNTYVWTADGGLFAETQETLDVQQERTGGSYSFKGMAGVFTDLTVAVGGAGIKFELDALFGGHLDLTVTKAVDSVTTFGVAADLGGVEGDLYLRDVDGVIEIDPIDQRNPRMVKAPGKVDAYRFMTFFLEPETLHFDHFFARVVDPIWLEQSDDPNAVALRQARQVDKAPPCWRVMHRVTYVSRILPPIGDPVAAPLERTMKELDIDSNFELIQLLDPFVADEVTNYGRFTQAIRDTLRAYHPELQAHAGSIIQFMSLYYGIDQQAAELAGASDRLALDPGIPLDPVVDAGPSEMTTEVGRDVELSGTVEHHRQPIENLLVSWSTVSGPESTRADFDDTSALQTTVSLPVAGVYVLRLTVTDGVLALSDDVRVAVNREPLISAGLDQDVLPGEVTRMTGQVTDDGLGDPSRRGVLGTSWTKIGGPGEVTFAAADSLVTTVGFSASGRYLLRLTVDNGSFAVDDDVVVSVAARVTTGLEALYVFEEGSGSTVRDVAAVGAPMPLRLEDGSNATWAAGSLHVAEPSLLHSPTPAARLLDAIRATGELTIEAWIDCALADQPGLARIVTCSAGPLLRNFVLGQRGRRFHVALRTDETSSNGSERALAGGTAVVGRAAHVVCTRGRDGRTVLYVDGEQVAERTIGGSLDGWDTGLALALANEHLADGTADQAWSGAYHLVALYSRTLTAAEIRQNHLFGADVNLSPYVAASADQMIDLPGDATVSGSLLDDRLLADELSVRWTQAGGPTSVEFVDADSLETTVSFTESGRYVLRLTATEAMEGGLSASDETVIVVNQAPDISAGVPASVMFPAVGRLAGRVLDDGLGRPSGEVTLAWVQVDGPAHAVIAEPTQAKTDVELPEPGAYTFRLSADNGKVPSTSATTEIYANTRPVVRADAPTVADLADGAALAAEIVDSGMYDPIGTVTRRWSMARGAGDVAFRTPSALRTTATFTGSGVYELTMTVTTESGGSELTGSASVTVVANEPPTVDAGPDLEILLPSIVELEGTVSDDGFPDPPGEVTVQWSKRSGPGDATFADDRSPYTTVEVSRKGSYELELSARDHEAGSAVVGRMRLAATALPRVEDGLLTLYRFDGQEGSTVTDMSDRGPVVNLAADGSVSPDTLTWLGPGLRLRQPTRLLGGVASEELLAALRAANEITIEAWIHPAAAVARGASPGRIVTYSADHSNRFFTLGQTTTGRYQVRLRTTETDDNGMSGRVEVSAPAGLSHVVFTRDSAGSIAVHVDGAPQLLAHDSIGGTFDDWRLDAQLPFDFALGDEIGGGRPWLGTYGLVAIYERALSSDEVRRNFYAELE